MARHDTRGRYAGKQQQDMMQGISQRRQGYKPLGQGVGSAGGRPVVETELRNQNERVGAKNKGFYENLRAMGN